MTGSFMEVERHFSLRLILNKVCRQVNMHSYGEIINKFDRDDLPGAGDEVAWNRRAQTGTIELDNAEENSKKSSL